MDRIDLQVELERLSLEERFASTEENASPRIRKTVEAARQLQAERFKGTGIPFNAAIPGGSVRDYCNFSDAGFDQYKATIEGSRLSTRSMDRLAKVTRTIADLEADHQIDRKHVVEAASFVTGGMLRDNLS